MTRSYVSEVMLNKADEHQAIYAIIVMYDTRNPPRSKNNRF